MATTSKDKKKNEPNDSVLRKKWGGKVIDAGWIGFPNILIERQQALGLKPLEMNIILVLLKYWWEEGKNPFPSKTTIAEIVGRDISTVRKAIKELEDKKFIKRNTRFLPKGGQTSNVYDLTGLVKKLGQEAAKINALDKERKSEDAALRRGRK